MFGVHLDPGGPRPDRPNVPQPFMPRASRWAGWVLPSLWMLALALRTQLLGETSAFMDEALNVAYGRIFLARPLAPPLSETLYWHNGWYLWPVAAALAERAGGLYAQRLLAALLGAGTTVLVGVLGTRTFSRPVGWAAALLYALLGPAVFAASMGEYDAAAIAALAAGACLLARALEEDRPRQWLGGAALLFTAFLSKYVAALYFPLLVAIAALRSRRSIRWLALPLAAACAAYAVTYRAVLANVIRVLGADDARLHLSRADRWAIYVTDRVDLWVLVALSVLCFVPLGAEDRRARRLVRARAAMLCACAAVMFLLHFVSRASDVRFSKHAAYSLVFLAPAAAEGLRRLIASTPFSPARHSMGFAVSVAALAVALGTLGGTFHTRGLVFWPDLAPASAWLEGKLDSGSRVLTNDLGLLQEVSPPLPFRSVTGPYALQYAGLSGAEAYARAVDDGLFDYVVLTPPGPEEAVAGLQAAVRSPLAVRYTQVLHTLDPMLSWTIDVYARREPGPRQPTGPRLDLLSQVPLAGSKLSLEGRVRRANPGFRVAVDVLTNRWYPQGQPVVLVSGDSLFAYTVYLGRRCGILVRARLLDGAGRVLAADARAVELPGCQANPPARR